MTMSLPFLSFSFVYNGTKLYCHEDPGYITSITIRNSRKVLSFKSVSWCNLLLDTLQCSSTSWNRRFEKVYSNFSPFSNKVYEFHRRHLFQNVLEKALLISSCIGLWMGGQAMRFDFVFFDPQIELCRNGSCDNYIPKDNNMVLKAYHMTELRRSWPGKILCIASQYSFRFFS